MEKKKKLDIERSNYSCNCSVYSETRFRWWVYDDEAICSTEESVFKPRKTTSDFIFFLFSSSHAPFP